MAESNDNTTATAAPEIAAPARGYWAETWIRFRRRKPAMCALGFVIFLSLVAIFSPMIAGTKPIVCKYKGKIYFPALSYYNRTWEPAVFHQDKFRKYYPNNLKKNDPDSWAVWPLVYQDPKHPVEEGEFDGIPGNPQKISEGQPNRYNFFGTHEMGVDVFSQVVHGARVALLVGFLVMGIAATIGISVGATAGYLGGWVDMILSRLIEVVLCVPSLVLILALLAVVEQPSIWHIMAVLGITRWPPIARLARAEFMKLKQTEYVLAARGLGAGTRRIMFRHILPNALAPVMVPIAFGIASAILIEAGLSLLGFGSPDTISWGSILQSGMENPEAWWLILFPGAAIFLTVLAYNLIGEGIQEATDPRLREAGK